MSHHATIAPGATDVAKVKEPFNPFYILVVLVGTAFAITTFAYGVMAYRAVSPSTVRTQKTAGQEPTSGEKLMEAVDEYGMQAMGIELAVLGVVTVAAMGLDRLRTLKNKDASPGPGGMPE
jgi:hypothetical protein